MSLCVLDNIVQKEKVAASINNEGMLYFISCMLY